MSLHAPFIPMENSTSFNDRPFSTTLNKNTLRRNVINECYVGHVYSIVSTVPDEYLYWFSPSPLKSLTVTGESKSQILKQFRSAVLQSKLEAACINGIELHCSGYLQQTLSILIDIIGSHIHIHNPNICSRLLERYKRFERQMNIPKNAGTVHFPDENDEHFFNKPEVLGYRSTLNCQPVRNFVIEMISLITLSHQKEMTLPIINPKDVNPDYLLKAATVLKIGGTNLSKIIAKNELKIVLDVIEKCLLHKTSKTEDVIFWILWLIKIEEKIKRKGENLPCKTLKVTGVIKAQTDHWVWYIWKSVFARLSFCPVFKKKQIIDIYEVFKIDFTKIIVLQRLPLLFFAIRLLSYDVSNNFPSILNNLHLHIQAYSNVNTLYRNLQIKLARKSWVNVTGNEKTERNDRAENEIKPKKITKTMNKEIEHKKTMISLNQKTAYLDIIPKANDYF